MSRPALSQKRFRTWVKKISCGQAIAPVVLRGWPLDRAKFKSSYSPLPRTSQNVSGFTSLTLYQNRKSLRSKRASQTGKSIHLRKADFLFCSQENIPKRLG